MRSRRSCESGAAIDDSFPARSTSQKRIYTTEPHRATDHAPSLCCELTWVALEVRCRGAVVSDVDRPEPIYGLDKPLAEFNPGFPIEFAFGE